MALAIFYPLMVWSVWNGERKAVVLLRAAAIPAIAYGLSAFWLTPSYVRITLIDLKWVAQPASPGAPIILLIAIALYCGLSWRFATGLAEYEWSIFTAGAVLFFSLFVLGFVYFGLRIVGEATKRSYPEIRQRHDFGRRRRLRGG